MIGRDTELAEVLEVATSNSKGSKLISIVGPPGEGKSLLAAAAAWTLWDIGKSPSGLYVIDWKNANVIHGPGRLGQIVD